MPYVDRILETQKITNYFNRLDRSSILLVFSKTGVGKSTISQRVLEKLDSQAEKTLVFRVFTSKINKNCDTSKGDFLRDIFSVLSKAKYDDKKLSCKYYLTHLKNVTHRKHIFSKLLSEIEGQSSIPGVLVNILGKFALKWVLKLDEFDYESLLDNSSISLQIINGYIDYVLGKTRIILNIDNIQNIDDISYRYITEWMIQHKKQKHFFLFEYTTSKGNTGDILRLRDDLIQLGVPVDLMEIKKMDTNYAIEAAQSNAIGISDAANAGIPPEAEEFYIQSEGNIRSLEDFIRQYNRENCHIISFAPLADTLKSLTDNECIMFCTICLNGSKMHYYELQYVLCKYCFPLDKILNTLEEKYALIERKEDYIYIKHASIYDEWMSLDNSKIHKANTVAYEALRDHYEQLIHSPRHSGSKRGFVYLLKLYTIYEPEKIYEILNDFDDYIQDFITPDQLGEYIKSIEKELHSHAKDFLEFYYRLIDICLEIKLFTLAGNLLETIKEHSDINRYIFYRCNILNQSENHIENIQFIKEALIYVENITLSLYLKLFLLISYRSINDSSNVQRIDSDIRKDLERTPNLLFKAFYLRLAELYKDRIAAIADVKQSVEIFKYLHLTVQEAKSRVELSFLYATTGDIVDAFNQMDIAEKPILKTMANKHVFLNNKAALYMLSDHFGSEIWDMLDNAELVALSLFDKLVIYNNKLAFRIQKHDIPGARFEKSKIVKHIDSESDKHLLALIYYNLHIYYQLISDIQNSEKCLARCYQYRKYCKSIDARLASKSTIDGTDILLSKPWHVCFLDFWSIDYIDQIAF